MRFWGNTGTKAAVDVGWLLQTDHAQFIWDEPRSNKRVANRKIHAKAVQPSRFNSTRILRYP
jgi:hypothetical protein